jgi:hypothetical protein
MFVAKKEMELRALLGARRASSLLPNGRIVQGEEPDFQIITETGVVGVELSELMPLPRNSSFSSPVAEERLHEGIIQVAERGYYDSPGAVPVKVSAYFWNIERGKNKRQEMADGLVSFVRSHCHEAAPYAHFLQRNELPDGFSTITIDSNPSPWWSGECMGYTYDGIRQQFATRIAAKNELLPRYRANLPNSPIWLLLYSCAAVSRGVEIPHGICEWSFPFKFERVLFYASLGSGVEEIRRASVK